MFEQRSVRALFVGVALFLSMAAAAAPRIGVVTMQPGLDYWARFGHDAILVDDRADHPDSVPMLYNYGYFDFNQPYFLLHFAQGYMSYQLAAVPFREDLAGYAYDRRGVSLQWLKMTPEQATNLQHFLQWNALPQNSTYRYDYFTADCATRVRDALDHALGGELHDQLTAPSQGFTYRSEAVRLGAPDLWLGLSMHFALSSYADHPLSRWDEAFIPMRLQDSLRTIHNPDGTPLVEQEMVQMPQWRIWFVLLGLGLAVLALVGTRYAPRMTALFSGAFWLVCGLAGTGLIAIWGLTEHVAIWDNENILLTSPLCFALLPGAWEIARGRVPSPFHFRFLLLVAVSAGIALFLKCLPFRIQSNGDWIALFLPIHLALAYAGRPSRASVLPLGEGAAGR
jgi:hypothetical protein